MEEIRGSAAITLETLETTPRLEDDFFGVADRLMPAAKVLAGEVELSDNGVTLLSGYILECLLKAYLAHHDFTEEKLIKLGHKLIELYNESINRGLPNFHTWRSPIKGELPTDVTPLWIKRLNALHTKPHHLRYPTKHNGLILPGVQPMVADLQNLLEIVREAIH